MDLINYKIDINYSYKDNKNKVLQKSQKLIIFGLKENIKYLDKKLTTEFFLDTIFKVVPVKFRTYKLMALEGLPINKNKSILVCLVLIKHNDSISYDKLIIYLIDN